MVKPKGKSKWFETGTHIQMITRAVDDPAERLFVLNQKRRAVERGGRKESGSTRETHWNPMGLRPIHESCVTLCCITQENGVLFHLVEFFRQKKERAKKGMERGCKLY